MHVRKIYFDERGIWNLKGCISGHCKKPVVLNLTCHYLFSLNMPHIFTASVNLWFVCTLKIRMHCIVTSIHHMMAVKEILVFAIIWYVWQNFFTNCTGDNNFAVILHEWKLSNKWTCFVDYRKYLHLVLWRFPCAQTRSVLVGILQKNCSFGSVLVFSVLSVTSSVPNWQNFRHKLSRN